MLNNVKCICLNLETACFHFFNRVRAQIEIQCLPYNRCHNLTYFNNKVCLTKKRNAACKSKLLTLQQSHLVFQNRLLNGAYFVSDINLPCSLKFGKRLFQHCTENEVSSNSGSGHIV